MQLHVPSDIAPRVMGKMIEITDEETGIVKKQRETINNLSEVYGVSINYNRRKQLFEVSGTKDNVEKVSQTLSELAEKKEKEFEEFIERKKQRRIDRQEYLFRQKKREIKQRVKEAQQDKKDKKENARKTPYIDSNNPFAMLEVDDDEEYSKQLELRNQYDKRQRDLTKKNRKLEKKAEQLKRQIKAHEKQHDEETERLKSQLKDELNDMMHRLHHYHSMLEQSFEDYELHRNPEENEEEIQEVNFDDVEDDNDDNEVQDEQYDDVDDDGPPRNRGSYQRYQYKNKHNNTNKSETWTYAKDNTKKDRGRHNRNGPRHHNRNPEHYDKNDFEEDMDNARRIPTDRIKDKLGELVGSDFKSDFPPLVKQ